MAQDSEWRDIWQEIIRASRATLLGRDTAYHAFDALEQAYPGDKMIVLEKAIAAECLGDRTTATALYRLAADEATGLPVKHWRSRAQYFLCRIESRGCCVTADINPAEGLTSVLWNTYFNVHSYCHLDDYLRYLAISSVSRMHSEPAMATVIFRTCLELGVWTCFKAESEVINAQHKRNAKTPRDIGLDVLLEKLHGKKLIKNSEYEVYERIRHEGNIAAHPGTMAKDTKPFSYTDEELVDILLWFNQTLRFLDARAGGTAG